MMKKPPTNPLNRFLVNYWGIILVLVAWQVWVSISGVNAIVMPQPANVLYDIFVDPVPYLTNGVQTLLLAAAGLLLGMLLGTAVAVLAWTSSLASGILVPLGLIFSSIPVVSLIPILARLFGYDIKTVLAIVAIISFFPAFVFTSAGLKALPPGSDDLFRVFGANRWRRFVHLVVPAAVPSWMIAFRLSAPPAVLSAMVAEFLMGTSGLGHMFRSAATDFNTERAFGTSLVATVISVTCFLAASLAERKVNEKWR